MSSNRCVDCKYFHLNPDDPNKNGYCYGLPPVGTIMMMRQTSLMSASQEMVPQTVSVEAIVNRHRPACHLFDNGAPKIRLQ